jgi:hypothetical protein
MFRGLPVFLWRGLIFLNRALARPVRRVLLTTPNLAVVLVVSFHGAASHDYLSKGCFLVVVRQHSFSCFS